MTEKKMREPLIKKLGIFNVLLLIVAFAACILALNKLTAPIALVRIVFQMAAIVFAFFYAVYGYKKDAARYYKAFMLILGLAKLAMLLVGLFETGSFSADVSTALLALSFVCAAILAFVKDLGKTKSVYAVLAMLVIDVVNEMILLVKFADVFSAVIVLAVSFMAVEFVLAKYFDKAERGTK